MTLVEAQKIFDTDFISQLTEIHINGNFGDAVMNPETVDIIEYFRTWAPTVTIKLSTNGSARNKKFWQDLARLKVEINFCLDGLEDTHHLYRQNTSYTTIIKNAQTFIQAGGNATWKMIEFDFNQHQRAEARELSKQLGFTNFSLINYGRNQGPVFNKHKKLSHVLGGAKNTDFNVLFDARKNDTVLLEDIVDSRRPAEISCLVAKQKSIYVSSTGDVYPCCFLGFNPKSYGHGHYHQAANAQVSPLIKNNNALTFPLKECVKWFANVEKSWNIPTFEEGRLVICNDVCGKSNK